jgi:hypothetical protein
VKLYLEKTHHRNRAGGVAQGEGSEFKSQYCQKKKAEVKRNICNMNNIYFQKKILLSFASLYR